MAHHSPAVDPETLRVGLGDLAGKFKLPLLAVGGNRGRKIIAHCLAGIEVEYRYTQLIDLQTWPLNGLSRT